MKKQKLPPGLTHKKIKEIIDHYENQTDEEAEAEFEKALAEGKVFFNTPIEAIPLRPKRKKKSSA